MSDYVDQFFSAEHRQETPGRRRELRTELEQFVELRFDQELFGAATTLDISGEGMRVLSPKPLELGTCVFMMFSLPVPGTGGLAVEGEYIVIHCDRLDQAWKIGLRAYNLPLSSQNNIKQYLDCCA